MKTNFEEFLNEEFGEGAYSGPPLQGGMGGGMFSTGNLSNTLAAGGSDGMLGNTGAMGGEFPKVGGPGAKPFPTKYKQNVTDIKTKETKKRLDAIKKLQKLKPSKMMNFDQDVKPKKTMKSFADFQK